jgi:hypothetical protein
VLDKFCATLTNEAQLKIAIRLTRLALPVWQNHFVSKPDDLARLNALVTEKTRIPGALREIRADLPEDAVNEIASSLELAEKVGPFDIARLQENPKLMPLLYTFTGPLSQNAWDATLPRSVRLVFTAVWNILTWILHREHNAEGETHIYLAINQAADVLMSEHLCDVDELNKMLAEYKNEKSQGPEGSGHPISYPKQSELDISASDAYAKIIGPVPAKDPPSLRQAREILRQMREEDKSYWDSWEEYYSGTSVTYGFDAEAQKFKRVEIDIVVAAFFETHWLTQDEMAQAIQKMSLHDLRKAGFNI